MRGLPSASHHPFDQVEPERPLPVCRQSRRACAPFPLLSRAIRASIRRRHPELLETSRGDLPWGHAHWSSIFEDVDSGLLHPYHDLKDGWEKNIKVSTREKFRSKNGGKKLQEMCAEIAQTYGPPPVYITSPELVSNLRTSPGGRKNWSVDVKDWSEWEHLGSNQGGKCRFVVWHGTTDWVTGAYTPPPGKKVGGKAIKTMALEALRASPHKELSQTGIAGYIRRTYPGT